MLENRDAFQTLLDELADVFNSEPEPSEPNPPTEVDDLLNTPVVSPVECPEPYKPEEVYVVDPLLVKDEVPEESGDSDERQVWGERSRKEIFAETDLLRNRLRKSIVNVWPDQLTHGGRLDFMEIESLKANTSYYGFPPIGKVVVVTRAMVDATGAFETAYPLLLDTPIDLASFFKRFREGSPLVEQFVLACFRRRLRLTTGAARVFIKNFGTLHPIDFVVNLAVEGDNGTRVGFGLAQEDPSRVKLGSGWGEDAGRPATLIISAMIQGHFSAVPEDELEGVISELYKLDVRSFNFHRNNVLGLLKKGPPSQFGVYQNKPLSGRRNRRHRR